MSEELALERGSSKDLQSTEKFNAQIISVMVRNQNSCPSPLFSLIFPLSLALG
jgi:hypothetical protein